MRNDTKTANRTLARAIRAVGLVPNGQVWSDAKSLVGEGLSPEQAARLVRSLLPAAEQDAARSRVLGRTLKGATGTKVPNRPRVPEVAPVAQAPTRLSSRALEVKAGKVLRDSKGRLVSRDVQEAFADLNA